MTCSPRRGRSTPSSSASSPPTRRRTRCRSRQARRQRLEGGGIFPPPTFLPERARDLTIEGRSGPIGLRVIAPEQTAVGAYLHIHGGGWALSAANLQDPLLVELADATGLCAVSVDYRLAPEHPYPAALDDCEDAALWLLRDGFARARAAGGGDDRRRLGGRPPERGDAPAPARPPRDHRRLRRGQPHLRRLRPVDDAQPAPVGRAQPDPLDADPALLRRPLPAGPRRRGAPRPRHLAALRRPARHAAGALHGRHAWTRCSTTRSSCTRAGSPRARPPSCARGPRRSTASTPSRCG